MHGGFGSQCPAVGFGSFVGQRPALWRWDQSNSASVAPIGPTSCVQISIKNHGAGVPVSESILKSWLNPFIRGRLRRDGRQVEGAGLGLALARELVMAWEGTLILEQSAVMDGSLTTALLTLPISPAARDGEVPVNAQKDQV